MVQTPFEPDSETGLLVKPDTVLHCVLEAFRVPKEEVEIQHVMNAAGTLLSYAIGYGPTMSEVHFDLMDKGFTEGDYPRQCAILVRGFSELLEELIDLARKPPITEGRVFERRSY